jgi:hypothetical protein
LLAPPHPAARAGIAAPLDQDRQFEIGVVGKIERDLLVGKQSISRMLERALAAFASGDSLFVPESSELRAPALGFLDELAKAGS